MSAPDDQPDGRESQFSAYSNYHQVTGAIASAIDEANDAYAHAAARKGEGKSLRSADAIRLRKTMKKAAMMLLPELRANQEADDIYGEILTRWQTDGAADAFAADGGDEWPPYLHAIDTVQLRGTQEFPPWLEQFMIDIRQAGWDIGHLQAGETTQTESLDPAEDQANALLRD